MIPDLISDAGDIAAVEKNRLSAQLLLDLSADDLIRLFNQSFLDSENTELVRGAAEPVYLPADTEYPHHRIIFAHGFFASALHEISHWCVAGAERRLLEDFGYWYEPDGRTAAQQAEFEQVEVKPQALEWIFSKACGIRFSISSDNLSGEASDTSLFKARVQRQVQRYLQDGLNPRSKRWAKVLAEYYQQPFPMPSSFNLADLD